MASSPFMSRSAAIEMPPIDGAPRKIDVENNNEFLKRCMHQSIKATITSASASSQGDGDNDDDDDDDNNDDAPLLAPERSSIDNKFSNNNKNNRRVRKNYLSMIGMAYILTIMSPGTILWSSSSSLSSCDGNPFRIHNNATNATFTSTPPITNSSIDNNILANTENGQNHNATNIRSSSPSTNQTTIQIIGKCMYNGGWSSIHMPTLLKLSFWTLVLLISFFNIQGSNPGVLTKEIMCRLDAVDKNGPSICASDVSDDCEVDDDLEKMVNGVAECMERQTFMEPPPPPSPSSIKGTTLLPPQESIHRQRRTPQKQREQQHRKQQQQQQKPTQKLYPHTRRKYCTKCQIHPPLRSHHCKSCNACIATFDHHCQFLNTCIGERNHFRFWVFVTLNVVCLNAALGIVGSGHVPKFAVGGDVGGGMLPSLRSSQSSQSQSQLLPIYIMIGQAILLSSKLYMYAIYIIASILWMIHTGLALGNCTTFEITKGPKHVDYLLGTSMMDLPFGRGGVWNNLRIFVTRDDVCFWLRTTITTMGARLWIVNMGARVGYCLSRLFGWKFCCRRYGIGYFHCDEPEVTIPMSTQAVAVTAAGVDGWMPVLWKMPEFIDRESEDWWNHPWQNKYWSCC